MVEYWETLKDGKVKHWTDEACFSNMQTRKGFGYVQSIKYHLTPIDSALTKEEIEFFLKFISRILEKRLFTVEVNYENRTAVFVLDTSKLNYGSTLLYLTAFRYLEEFANVIKYFYACVKKDKSTNQLFQEFQQIHHDFVHKQKEVKQYLGRPGHALLYPYYTTKEGVPNWSTKNEDWMPYGPINLVEFRRRLKIQMSSVYDFFSMKYSLPPIMVKKKIAEIWANVA